MGAVLSLSALTFAWCMWGLLSEVLLAATHLKVLLCIGKPYPAKELSSKRTTYFVYDLLSPWMSLAAVAAMALPSANMPVLDTAVFTLPSAQTLALSATGVHNSSTACAASCPVSYLPVHSVGYPTQQKHSAHQPLYTAAPGTIEELLLQGHRSPNHGWGALSSAAGSVLSGPNSIMWVFTSLQQLPPPVLQISASHVAAALLLLVMGHAVLHLYYIASWHTRHSKNVVEMSASKDMASRLQRFSALEVAWFVLGTSYDICTHVVISGLLLQSMWATMTHVQ